MANEIVRMLPNDIEAEQAILGSMIIDKDAVATVLESINAEDFYREDNKEIFSAICDLFETSKPIDLLSIKEQLRLRGTLDAIGGITYIAELSTKVPTSANVGYYAKIVEEKSLLRKLIRASTDIVNMGYEASEEVQTIVDSAEKKIFDIVNEIDWLKSYKNVPIIGLGGCLRVIGKADASIRKLNFEPGYSVDIKSVMDLYNRIKAMSLHERIKLFGESKGDIILGGAMPFISVVNITNTNNLYISDKGVKDGIVYSVLMDIMKKA